MRTEISFDEPLNVDWDGNELLLSDVLGTEGDLVLKILKKRWRGSCSTWPWIN